MAAGFYRSIGTRPSVHLAGQFEVRRGQGWVPVDFCSDVRGRWSLVKPCESCLRFMHDTNTQSLFCRVQWGEGHGPLNNETWTAGYELCGECARLRTCAICSLVGSPLSVKQRNFNCGLPDGNFWASRLMQCTACWNKCQAIVRREHQANEISQLANKLGNGIRHAKQQATSQT